MKLETENALDNILVALVGQRYTQLIDVDNASVSCSPQRADVRLACISQQPQLSYILFILQIPV